MKQVGAPADARAYPGGFTMRFVLWVQERKRTFAAAFSGYARVLSLTAARARREPRRLREDALPGVRLPDPII